MSTNPEPLPPEPDWVRKLGSAPPWVPNALFATGGAPLASLGFVPGWWAAVPTTVTAILFIAAVALAWLRHDRDKRLDRCHDTELRRLRNNLQDAYSQQLNEVSLAIYQVVHARIWTQPAALANQLRVVQKAVLGQVRNYLGPPEGVRTNLFVPSADRPSVLVAADWGFDGGFEPSSREFKKGDKTFDLSISKLHQLVEDVSAPSQGQPRANQKYGTYATYPVANQKTLFGILTIDAKNPGDLTDLDIQLMGCFAGVLALTFEHTKDARGIPREDASDAPGIPREDASDLCHDGNVPTPSERDS